MSKEKAILWLHSAESCFDNIEPIYISSTEDNIIDAIKCVIEAIKELEE